MQNVFVPRCVVCESLSDNGLAGADFQEDDDWGRLIFWIFFCVSERIGNFFY